jgi:acyl-CoA synthetase (NDP forming)
MLKATIDDALNSAGKFGWVLEPEAKRLLMAAGMRVPVFKVCRKAEDAVSWAKEIGYPVVAKVLGQGNRLPGGGQSGLTQRHA